MWFSFLKWLPKNCLSEFLGKLANIELPYFLLQAWIRGFVWWYAIDMSDYQTPITQYRTFNEFFTRALKPQARPIAQSPEVVVSPVDGTIRQFGKIEGNELIQIKGVSYTIAELLGSVEKAEAYQNGHFINIYLAPYNYHRIHSMVDGKVTEWSHTPGELWPVNAFGLANVPKLFARNERLVSYVTTDRGECALVKVGALVVGKIRVVYNPIASNHPNALPQHQTLLTPYDVKKGDELGLFEFGSTVIALFPPDTLSWDLLHEEQPVTLGQPLGRWNA